MDKISGMIPPPPTIGEDSDKEADERYDLRLMMSNSSTSDSESYAHLHSSRDYQTEVCMFHVCLTKLR